MARNWIRRNKSVSKDYLDKVLSNLTTEEQKNLATLVSKLAIINENTPFVKAFEID